MMPAFLRIDLPLPGCGYCRERGLSFSSPDRPRHRNSVETWGDKARGEKTYVSSISRTSHIFGTRGALRNISADDTYPKKAKVSGLPLPRFLRLAAAWRPNSIKRVLPGWSNSENALLALVRGSIELVVRRVAKVRDGIPCRFIEPSSTLHPLPPYRFSKVTDWRDPHDGCMPIPPPPTTLGGRDRWTMAGRQLSPYRSRASPETEAAGLQKFCTANRYCAHARKRATLLQDDCTARLPRTTRSKTSDPQCPSPTRRPFYESAIADKVVRNDNGAHACLIVV
jgi:hypothetical protein